MGAFWARKGFRSRGRSCIDASSKDRGRSLEREIVGREGGASGDGRGALGEADESVAGVPVAPVRSAPRAWRWYSVARALCEPDTGAPAPPSLLHVARPEFRLGAYSRSGGVELAMGDRERFLVHRRSNPPVCRCRGDRPIAEESSSNWKPSHGLAKCAQGVYDWRRGASDYAAEFRRQAESRAVFPSPT